MAIPPGSKLPSGWSALHIFKMGEHLVSVRGQPSLAGAPHLAHGLSLAGLNSPAQIQ